MHGYIKAQTRQDSRSRKRKFETAADLRADHAFYEQQQQPFRDGAGTDGVNRYTLLDKKEIVTALREFDTNPTVKIVFDTIMGGILGGGISWTSGEGKEFPEDSAEFHTEAYASYLRNRERHLKSIGWAPCSFTPHEQYNGVPCIIDVEQVDTYYGRNVFNQHKFLFVHRSDFGNAEFLESSAGVRAPTSKQMRGEEMFMGGRIMPNVYVFVEEAPTLRGAITSKLLCLRPIQSWLSDKVSCSTKAMGGRCNVPIITESVVTTSREAGQSFQTSVPMSARDGESISIDPLEAAREAATARLSAEVHARNIIGSDKFDKIVEQMVRNELLYKVTTPSQVLRVETGRKYVKPQLPEEPNDVIVAMVYVQQQVMMLFGLPPGLIQPESTRGKMHENQSKDLHETFMRNAKQNAQRACESIYHLINDEKRLADFIAAVPKGKTVKKTDLLAARDVHIRIAGVPSADVMNQLYVQGLLKHESYKGYLSKSLLLPEEDFYEKPELDLLDLIGGNKPDASAGGVKPKKPKAAKTAGSTSKSKSKAKPKPKT